MKGIKTIKLYIGRDRQSAKLLKDLSLLMRRLPKDKRPKLKVRVVKIEEPSEFPELLEQLEEIFGGLYTLEFRKYGIKNLPAIVVDDKKVLEGYFPNTKELVEILAYEGLAIEEYAEAAPAVQQQRIPIHTESRKEEVRERLLQPTPEEAALPVRIEEITEERPQAPLAEPELPPAVRREAPVLERPTVEVKEEVAPEAKADIRGTCLDCIFFDRERTRCTLLHVPITDPYNPLCGRKPRSISH